MTEIEASTILKAEIVHHPECSIFAEALGMAIQALEKQIATSSELKAYRANATEMKYKPICLGKAYDCGVCRAWIGSYGDNNYCWNCGKKIDWEGAERGEKE